MTTRRKPLRSHGRRRHPQAKAMARMGLLSVWGERHATKGYRPISHYERTVLGILKN